MKKLIYLILILQLAIGTPVLAIAQSIEEESLTPATTTPIIETVDPVETEATTTEPVGFPIEATSTEPTLEKVILDEPIILTLPVEEATTTVELDINGKFVKDDNLSQAEQLKKVRKFLEKNGLTEALAKLDQYEAEQKLPEQMPVVDEAKIQREAEEFANREPFKVETFKGEINKRNVKDFEKDFPQASNTGNLTRAKDITLNLASDNPNDYLSAGNEVTFSQAIKDKADELGRDPLRMFNFVRNNVTYVPYYGSKKGSDATLVELAGNDMDQASLMIAMLRYSGIPARYKHGFIKADIRTVTDLLGVESAETAAAMLAVNKIPYTLFITSTGQADFFVLEHTYLEAYIPYGWSMGATTTDSGPLEWVPMDPSINSYYYERLVDIVGHMKSKGFNVDTFFENYLNNQYGSSSPLDAFKSVASSTLHNFPPTYYPDLNYNDALVESYPKQQNLELIPNSLPYTSLLDLGTYAFVPTELRHTLKFSVKDKNDNLVINNQTLFVSDIADKEMVFGYSAASTSDQTTINSFATIYDVVPLSIVNVKPTLRVNGSIIAQSASSTTLGQKQKYILEFLSPTRVNYSSAITQVSVSTYSKEAISGGSDGIAINTDRVISPELRPTQDTNTTSFVNDQFLYSSALSYIAQNQAAADELSEITGASTLNTATLASVNNGLVVTNSGGNPYSFSWVGLRIDAVVNTTYANRLGNVADNYKEFQTVLLSNASHLESEIFDQAYSVKSMATVKGIKLVNSGTFPGITMKKITSFNESVINTLNVSASTKIIFHSAVQSGKIIYTPTAPVTYGAWNGLFYVVKSADGSSAGYIIGEGLNGGYSACTKAPAPGALCVWKPEDLDRLIKKGTVTITAVILSPLNNDQLEYGKKFNLIVNYSASGAISSNWTETKSLDTKDLGVGTRKVKADHGATAFVNVKIKRNQLGESYNNVDKIIFEISKKYKPTGYPDGIPPDLLKSLIFQESKKTKDGVSGEKIFEPRSYRYEVHKDYDWYSRQSSSSPRTTGWVGLTRYPEKFFTISGKNLVGETISQGKQVPSDYLQFSTNMGGGLLNLSTTQSNGNVLASEVYDNNPGKGWYSRPNYNFTAQLLLAASYGLTQTLYEVALVRGYDVRGGSGTQAKQIDDLFNPSVSIDLGAKHLTDIYTPQKGWSTTFFEYNGGFDDPDPTKYDSVMYANEIMERWNAGNGVFKPIIQ